MLDKPAAVGSVDSFLYGAGKPRFVIQELRQCVVQYLGWILAELLSVLFKRFHAFRFHA